MFTIDGLTLLVFPLIAVSVLIYAKFNKEW